MLKEEINTNNWARVCDMCRSTACTVYCRADLAYLCTGCDTRIHMANRVALLHERVLVCMACKRAPAAFIFKADAAHLCTICDAEIHSANPLAHRHHRDPILPLPCCVHGPPASVVAEVDGFDNEDDEEEATSWLMANLVKDNENQNQNQNQNQNNNWNLFGDEYLDLIEYNSCGGNYNQLNIDNSNNTTTQVQQKRHYGDSVVPVQCGDKEKGLPQQQQLCFPSRMEYENSSIGYVYPTSMTHSVPISSMDVGLVPESTNNNDSISHPRLPKGSTIDLFSARLQMPTQLTPVDREARVLRYKEKKKTRKFEKRIRYTSRKAYAETRPRIKGRFVKRTKMEETENQIYCSQFMSESGYGIVPSF